MVPEKFPSTLEKLYAISGVWLTHGPQWKSVPAGGMVVLAVALAVTRSGYGCTRAAQYPSGRGYVPVEAAGASPHAVPAGVAVSLHAVLAGGAADRAIAASESPAIARQMAISPARRLPFPSGSVPGAIHQPGRSA